MCLQRREGVYDDPGCSTGSEHAVVLAGYGRDEKTGLDYWLVRNSHGKTWGLLGGHFMIRRGVNRCGIENYAHYVSIN